MTAERADAMDDEPAFAPPQKPRVFRPLVLVTNWCFYCNHHAGLHAEDGACPPETAGDTLGGAGW